MCKTSVLFILRVFYGGITNQPNKKKKKKLSPALHCCGGLVFNCAVAELPRSVVGGGGLHIYLRRNSSVSVNIGRHSTAFAKS